MDTLARLPTTGLHLALMLALTFATGLVDAVCYLGLDQVFTANMTGNVLLLGMALAGGGDLAPLGPVLALVGFVVGGALVGRVLKDSSEPWSTPSTWLLSLVAVVVVAVGVVLLVTGGEPHRAVRLSVTAALGVAMGTQAAAARFIGVKDVTTVVVTGTITALAIDSPLGNGRQRSAGRRSASVALLVAGAALGALLLAWHPASALLAAGLLIAAVTVLGDLHTRAVRATAPSPQP
ncbi:DUF1275 domain-containing protein [Nocardioides sp. dk4132]|uniref:YoaK family protein n=1 Tax=unclassified Nocardioides TaxID=2615069 RepID=UPI001295B8D9|nr:MULTISPECIES: YoaK family protein [unclassified Nocardioides]MQW74300.1 DUF1275 domain-containing protein [Nocardioides sp. dk4132]QGA06253.1 DUF1275 domain-containing protein [Nocardioides sp. dk884]